VSELHKLYRRPYYYDIALARDVGRDADFIADVFGHYHGGRLGSVLEIACGPGYHACELARRGVHVTALDLEAEMLDFAAARAAAEGVEVNWMLADMRQFHLNSPVEMAICMFDGLDALTENDDLIQHFCVVADNLLPGGLYLIDLTHPREVDYAHYADFRYTGERHGVQVEIAWGINNPRYDLITATARTEIELRIREKGEETVIRDVALERLLFPQEIVLLARCSGALRVVGWHGDYDLKQPLDYSDSSKRMIAVLQKKG